MTSKGAYSNEVIKKGRDPRQDPAKVPVPSPKPPGAKPPGDKPAKRS